MPLAEVDAVVFCGQMIDCFVRLYQGDVRTELTAPFGMLQSWSLCLVTASRACRDREGHLKFIPDGCVGLDRATAGGKVELVVFYGYDAS